MAEFEKTKATREFKILVNDGSTDAPGRKIENSEKNTATCAV